MSESQRAEYADDLLAGKVEAELLEQLGFPSRPIKADGVILAAIWALLMRARIKLALFEEMRQALANLIKAYKACYPEDAVMPPSIVDAEAVLRKASER